MPAHVHAELMKQYAEDAMVTDRPWKLWEVLVATDTWVALEQGPIWSPGSKYRRKPRTININGHEVPEPMRVAPKYGSKYFCADIVVGEGRALTWSSDEVDCLLLSRGLCHSTKEAAEAHAKALFSFTQAK